MSIVTWLWPWAFLFTYLVVSFLLQGDSRGIAALGPAVALWVIIVVEKVRDRKELR